MDVSTIRTVLVKGVAWPPYKPRRHYVQHWVGSIGMWLSTHPGSTVGEVTAGLGANYANTTDALARMAKDGRVTRVKCQVGNRVQFKYWMNQ